MNWDDFLPEVLPYVVGCGEALAINHIIKAAREFCAGTLVWQVEAQVVTVADQAVYAIPLASGLEIVRLLNVNVNGTDYLVPNLTNGRRLARASVRDLATLTGPKAITLSAAPSAAGLPILVECAVKPTLAAESWPDDLSEHVTDIAPGAISSLCLLPKVDWTDSTAAATQRVLFNDRKSTVGHKVSKGFGRSQQAATVTFL
ncbi:MAG: hypothetical protein EOP40_19985 [Rubrivivax sp.]|nr:MAG: hypothetical protein EOP40_19985 [Rubrivivax sp.]